MRKIMVKHWGGWLTLAGLMLVPALGAADWVEPMREEWSREVGQPVASLVTMRAHALRLWCGKNTPEGPALLALSLAGRQLSAVGESLDMTGVDQMFRLVDIEPVTGAIRFAIGGMIDDSIVIYTAPMRERGGLGGWELLDGFPSPQPESLLSLASAGEFLIVYTKRPIESGTVTTGWVVNLAAPAEDRQWIELPFAQERRQGHAALAMESVLAIVGGVREGDGGPVGYVDRMPFDGLGVTPWQRTLPGLPGVVREVAAASSSQGLFVAPRKPLSTSEDTTTSGTIYTSFHMGNGRLSPWTPNPIARVAEPVRAMAFDPANSHLIVASESGNPDTIRFTAYQISSLAVTHRHGLLEAEKANMEILAAQIKAINIDEMLLEAREENGFGIVVLSDGTRRQDLELRAELNKASFRYMIGTSQITYFPGAQGSDIARRYGINRMPALILLTADGAVERVHQGSIPSVTEMLDFTAPTRAPRQ